MEKIKSITITDFPRKILLSKSRRAKYFIKDIHGLPKKYKLLDTAETEGVFLKPGYSWKVHKINKLKVEIRLFDDVQQEYVIRNPRVAGTENWVPINGQQLYNQGYNPHVRNKIVDVIHDHVLSFLEGQTPITKYPIYITYTFICQLNDLSDVDNFALPYYKCIQDCLVKSGIIINDTWKYVAGFKVVHNQLGSNDLIEKIIVDIYINN